MYLFRQNVKALIGKSSYVLICSAADYNSKLVAARSAEVNAAVRKFPQTVCCFAENCISAGVSHSIVDILEIVKVDTARNVLLIKGAIPGPKGGIITVSNTVKSGK